MDKIGQFKGYLRCIDYKCNSRLEVIFGLEMTTVKAGKKFQFHELVTEKMLRNPDNYQGLNHKCTEKCTAKCTTVHKCKGFMRDFIREFDRLSETEQKNRLIPHCLKLPGARKIVFQKDYDEPCDSDADYDSDPDSEAEPDFDYNSDPE